MIEFATSCDSRGISPHAASWVARDARGGAVFKRRVAPDLISALEEAMGGTRTIPLDFLRPSHFGAPSVRALMEDIDEALVDGPGVVWLTGLPRRRWSEDECIRAYWGLGLQLGHPEIQDLSGARVGHVKQEAGGSNVRGFKSSRELTFHSDAYELLGLMCLEKAASGGTTKLVSADSVFRILQREHPEAIPPLLRGFWHLPLEAGGSRDALTRVPIPVVTVSQQRIRCMYLPKYMRDAARAMNVPFPKELEDALVLFREIANREELTCEFDLEPGDILFCNNLVVLHSRTEFTDEAARPRHLVRLWLTSRTAPMLDPALLERGNVYNRLYAERHRGT